MLLYARSESSSRRLPARPSSVGRHQRPRHLRLDPPIGSSQSFFQRNLRLPAENLTQDQAWRDIQYAIDHGYPVAANVLLGPGTYTPTGFFEGSTYEHWETVVGHFERDGKKWVKVGQVYGTESLGYDPLQEIPWDAYWSAIANWHGIVW